LAPVDWAQPPLGCIEEMVPSVPPQPCLDLSTVVDQSKDWPVGISQQVQDYWTSHRRYNSYCRATETLRREQVTPGSQTTGAIEAAWMITNSVHASDIKVAAIDEASRVSGIPPHVLTGAIYQESLFAELGISSDGGNYSCGVEQINLIGWCNWANQQSFHEKQLMNWPTGHVDCSDPDLMNLKLFDPIYAIAKTRLNGLPEYRLVQSHFQNIPLSSIESQWPSASSATQALRYRLIYSFINNCSDPRKGILATANELKGLYEGFVSAAFQAKDRYPAGQHFNRTCEYPIRGNAYPLQSGWLLAVAAYNAGPRAIEALAYYNHWDRNAINDPNVVQNFTPDQIVSSLYWSGKYNPSSNLIDYLSYDQTNSSWRWFTECVVQRHVARVMQNVTLLPNFFVDTLEGQFPCSKTTPPPPARQASSGVK
jgi:hypothetical protein